MLPLSNKGTQRNENLLFDGEKQHPHLLPVLWENTNKSQQFISVNMIYTEKVGI